MRNKFTMRKNHQIQETVERVVFLLKVWILELSYEDYKISKHV